MSRGVNVDGRGITATGRGYEVGPAAQIIDDFERGNLNPYSDTGDWSITTSTVFEGTYAADGNTDNYGNLFSAEGDGLENYPEPGTSFGVRVYDDGSSTQGQPAFGGTDGNNTYLVIIDPPDNNWEIARRSGGNQSTLVSSSNAPPGGEWLDVQVTWGTNGDIDVEIYRENGDFHDSLSTNDTTHTEPGFGARGDCYLDYARLL